MGSEPVRLVIWDLDETFWRGTLTEGGIEYVRINQEIVITLAQRGIMSSICSKNNLSEVRHIFEQSGLWDYFIFPSINWEPKGQRIAGIIEAVQLRPETVLLIDDNPQNLAEAQYFVPSIQIAGPDHIPKMLGSPLFKGKDDAALTRLHQYKILERRSVDQAAASDNTTFLRVSGIQITIDYDVEANIDRAVELINRTNQLNFTKARLSEDPETARIELRSLLRKYDIQAGFIKVRDRYGDYGYVGIYVKRSRLLHFAFSCRILNMGVETWVYRFLGCPPLTIVGDVLSDVKNDPREIDWITFTPFGKETKTIISRPAKLVDQMIIRGGCDLLAISHYLEPFANQVFREFFAQRNGASMRIDHSVFLKQALEGLSPEAEIALTSLGYERNELYSAVAQASAKQAVWIFSFWVDPFMMLYRHRETGIKAPFTLPTVVNAIADLTKEPKSSNEAYLINEQIRRAYGYLLENFDGVGVSTETDFKSTLEAIVRRAGTTAQVFILLSPGVSVDNATGEQRPNPADNRLNRWMREAIGNSSNVELIDPMRFVHTKDEMPETKHFNRIVYHRIASHILERIGSSSDWTLKADPCSSNYSTAQNLNINYSSVIV